MRRRSRLVIGSLLIGGITCLGIAFTSTSATPALSVAPAERSAAVATRTVGQDPSGAAALMVLGAVVVGANVVFGRASRRRSGMPAA
jgi:hypothetical protein